MCKAAHWERGKRDRAGRGLQRTWQGLVSAPWAITCAKQCIQFDHHDKNLWFNCNFLSYTSDMDSGRQSLVILRCFLCASLFACVLLRMQKMTSQLPCQPVENQPPALEHRAALLCLPCPPPCPDQLPHNSRSCGDGREAACPVSSCECGSSMEQRMASRHHEVCSTLHLLSHGLCHS